MGPGGGGALRFAWLRAPPPPYCMRRVSAEKQACAADTSTGVRAAFQIIAVSGEITLHDERIYIQVLQSAIGRGMGVLIRTCTGRRDYHGGRNHFVPLAMLDDLPALADYVRRVLAEPDGEG